MPRVSNRLLWALLALPVLAVGAWLALGRPGFGDAAPEDPSLIVSASSQDELLPPIREAIPDGPVAPPVAAPTAAPDEAVEAVEDSVEEVAEEAPARPKESMGALIDEALREPELDPEEFAAWTSHDEAVEQSRRTGRPVLLVFQAEGFAPSEELQRAVFDDAAAGVTVRASVIPVAIVHRPGVDDGPTDLLEQRYRVTRFPTLVLFSPTNGRSLRRSGFPGAAETLRWITEGAANLQGR